MRSTKSQGAILSEGFRAAYERCKNLLLYGGSSSLYVSYARWHAHRTWTTCFSLSSRTKPYRGEQPHLISVLPYVAA